MNQEFYQNHGINELQTLFPEEESKWNLIKSPIHLSSPYGLLRSPWNYNPNPYLTRYNSMNLLPFTEVSLDAKKHLWDQHVMIIKTF